jgi:hypothetical protein
LRLLLRHRLGLSWLLLLWYLLLLTLLLLDELVLLEIAAHFVVIDALLQLD